MSVCDTYRLQAYVDGQLGDSEARAVEAHLAGCAACARLGHGLRMLAEPLQLAAPEAAPEGLQERLLAAVAGLQPLRALTCATALEYVSLQLDGELSHEDCQRLAAHLEACGDCARAASETDMTSRMLRAIEPEAAPLGLLQRIEKATEERSAPRPNVWRRWAPSFAGVAAAAALVVGLLTHQPQPLSVAPLVAQAPAIQRAASLPEPTAQALPPQPAKLASAPASGAQVSAPVVASARAELSPRKTPAVAPAPSAAAWNALASAPAPAPAPEPHRPVAVASVRTTEPGTAAEVALAPSVRAEVPVAPAAHAPEAPSAVRLAAIDTVKATPAVEVAERPTVSHRRPTWVSRPAAAEREIYAADNAETRLADARTRLKDDARRIVGEEVRGLILR